jgi:hypothetical protein
LQRFEERIGGDPIPAALVQPRRGSNLPLSHHDWFTLPASDAAQSVHRLTGALLIAACIIADIWLPD